MSFKIFQCSCVLSTSLNIEETDTFFFTCHKYFETFEVSIGNITGESISPAS